MPTPIRIEIGNTRRWMDLVFWRVAFVVVIAPAAQAVVWTTACLSESMCRVPNIYWAAWLYLAANGLVFGLLFWGNSPAKLRQRVHDALHEFFDSLSS